MKKSLKFLAGALAAVTMLSSAMAVTASASSPVYTNSTVNTAPTFNTFPVTNKIPGTNTEIYPFYSTCPSHGFVDCSKHNCWWWNNVYSCTTNYDKLVEVDLSASINKEIDSKYVVVAKSTVPWGAVRKGTTSLADFGQKVPVNTDTSTGIIINNSCLLVGGKYYPSNVVNINDFFAQNTCELTLGKGQLQLMNTGYKMYSENSNVVLCYNDGSNQVLKAVDTGSTYVYLYTAGGVPFLRLSVTVQEGRPALSSNYPVVDIKPAAWNLSKIGESTTISVFATEEYSKDIELKVVYGKASIEGNKVTAKSNGAIVIRAYSESTPAVCGYAVLYVGRYTSSVIDGTWKPTMSGICGTFWNSNLWFEDGYVVCGWIQYNGIYIPVIKESDKTTETPPVTTQFYTLRELIDMCHGNLDLVLQVIQLYKENGITYYDTAYTDIIKNMLKDLDLSDYYFIQLH